ncbi:hypothetical protein BLS_007143 [Venturia inaequalis]|uniref:Uncharacterized protein n=1 Tax=Venturia inaequalis TaxID=5025 RepID=A0A8H3UEI6_VENIN|nr:hypothetical protein BLS_007143 [Venturia inaequalis]KAE9968001.1 hypothetical protein EG328_007827 [Venturia inaequalis]RDI86339.1 hypothetical protein Vi05172_g3935 [Venturia inaequalis]
MEVTSSPTPSSPASTSAPMVQEKQNDINIPLTRHQLHQLNNDQLVMTIMASSVLLQSRLNMSPINEVDKVLAAYETLVKREGKEYASTLGLTPQLDGLMEKIELIAEKEKPEGEFDYVLDFGSGAVYGKEGRENSRASSRGSRESLRSGSSNGSEAEMYLSSFHSSRSEDGAVGVEVGAGGQTAVGESLARKPVRDLGKGGE